MPDAAPDAPDPNAPRVPRLPPRAARVSRLGSESQAPTSPPDAPSPAGAMPMAPPMITPTAPSASPPMPPPPLGRGPAPTQPATSFPSVPGFEMKTLQPKPIPAAADVKQSSPSSTPYMFKPLNDRMATRSLILSVIGLLLFMFPVISLLGLGFGVISLQRIRRSNGMYGGERTALIGIWLGLLGVALGVLAITVFLAFG